MATISDLLEKLQTIKDEIKEAINQLYGTEVVSDDTCFDEYATFILNFKCPEPEPVTRFILTVNSNNTSFGTVSGGGEYEEGESATISATPKTGYHFVSWNDGDINPNRIITVTGNATYTAEFAINQYTLTVESEDVSKGIVNDVSGMYDYGTQINITATPNRFYRFANWSDSDTNQNRYVTITDDITLIAYFDEVSDDEKGYIDGDIDGGTDSVSVYLNEELIYQYTTQIGDMFGLEYVIGEDLKFTVEPKLGFVFKNMSFQGDSIYDNPYTLHTTTNYYKYGTVCTQSQIKSYSVSITDDGDMQIKDTEGNTKVGDEAKEELAKHDEFTLKMDNSVDINVKYTDSDNTEKEITESGKYTDYDSDGNTEITADVMNKTYTFKKL